MKKLEYTINCLEGVYCFVAEISDKVLFNIESTVEAVSSKTGELDQEKSKLFIEEINKAEIDKWDKQYKVEGSDIQDGIKWSMKFLDEDKEYISEGYESYQPYNYEHLVNAILLCDEESTYMF